ncbi:hypothetical protein RF11_01279 [Thelohanellus kitauei]|uniref:Uncharacterized protein n=1 Tax=Thelohanellus kitauei TaxID=669202 RepID=A0A0C2N3A6_THEKT|nr:hypothetical protein RF11_01279 [Thelohanellus kitauei]
MSALIDNLKNNPVFKEWTTNRFLFKIVQCFLQSADIQRFVDLGSDQVRELVPAQKTDRMVNGPKQATTKSGLGMFLLILCITGVAVLIVLTILYKTGSQRRVNAEYSPVNGADFSFVEDSIIEP